MLATGDTLSGVAGPDQCDSWWSPVSVCHHPCCLEPKQAWKGLLTLDSIEFNPLALLNAVDW